MLQNFLFGLVANPPTLPSTLLRMPTNYFADIHSAVVDKLAMAAGNEIRFLATGDDVEFTFDMRETNGSIEVYYGWFYHKKITLHTGINTITITYPKKFAGDKSWYQGNFNPDVCRLLLRGTNIKLLSMPTNLKPPTKSDIPPLTYVAYGTSITQGASTSSSILQYPSQVARNLQTNVINLGVRGSAYCEPAIAEYIVAELEWDFISLEISVNMLNQNQSAETFKSAAAKFINILACSGKPIFCISILPYYGELGIASDKKFASTTAEYRNALKELCTASPFHNVHYINGRDILKNLASLSTDLIHPNDAGAIEIGRELAELMSPFIKQIDY